ncbi:hypothetical protein QJ854_gp835 [Moumouvirus goulette]|uniref:Uncharacterized protein n=1 Tax=Moumouvirus goulette TaxID=1247379 RepID=M1PW40_9VIRU|nr:hypothetical protein QJ854_gp835 [Moumouvirus goulette]AGF84947.1 hypothetical protein glt_00138 [Moumouvirus goulette]
MANYFHVFYESDKNITPVSTHEYCKNLESAVELLLKTIRDYKKIKNGKNFYDPIDMNCDYNIRIYRVQVWKNISTGCYKFDIIEKVFPKINKPCKKLDTYIKLHDKPDMNVAKLCLEMYGQNITHEEIKKIRKNYIENIINAIDKNLDKCVNKGVIEINISKNEYSAYSYNFTNNKNKDIIEMNIRESKKYDNNGNLLISFNYKVLRYLDYYYQNKGYILRYRDDIKIYLFEKKLMEDIRQEFNSILSENDILKISYTDPEYKMKRDKKLYLFEKFIRQKDLPDNVKILLTDEIKSQCINYYYGKFNGVGYYESKKIIGKTFEDSYSDLDDSDDSDN